MNTSTTLKMSRTFHTTCETIWDAWTNPKHMKKWLFTQDKTNRICQNQLEVGGKWEITDEYQVTGKYLELQYPNKLVFTFKMPQLSNTVDTLTVELKPKNNHCEMIFSQDIVVPREIDWTDDVFRAVLYSYHTESEKGWDLMFQKLKHLSEGGI